ncbi:ATP-binding cassette domain-containing protein [Amycolatopsis ultiminotia]|uniref:ATP-binding cassette domain-containing protein n=1 Tax=Amycolatopsis ultiminotia TaxID=543629 RepID=UPI0031E614F4
MRGPRGAVFENVDLEVPPGGLLVVQGHGGSGRTALLLALAGRMRFVSGAIRVGGHTLPGAAHRVRKVVGVARAEPAVDWEGRLRVAEVIAERRWIGRLAQRQIRAALEVVGVEPPERALVEDLEPPTALLLAVGLTLAEYPGALVVDDVERGCTLDQRLVVWEALERVRGTGCTVLAGTTEPAWPVADPVVVELPRHSAGELPPATTDSGTEASP